MVPVFKTITHLPPYMGMLMGLAVMWITAEIMGGSKEKNTRYHLSPAYALRKIDSPSILFFLGILLCIAALEKIGVLAGMATVMDKSIGNNDAIVFSMGLLSSIVDNVPLMAAAQGMYPLSQFSVDNPL
jgi:Na+/H+ antiporter NhaD/arsenite permease-like protein